MDSLDQLRASYLTAALEGDAAAAVALLESAHGPFTSDDLRVRVLAWAQEEVGARWARAEISVAEEHLATAVAHECAAWLRALSQAPDRVENGMTVLASCVPGELHSFPLRLMCHVLEEAGHRVRYLGSSVPESHLVGMVAQTSPPVVALSCSVPINLPSARSTIEALRGLDPRPLIMVGGRAVDAGVETMGADIHAQDGHQALARLAMVSR